MKYRVVYGESRPAWEQIFATLKEAEKFALKQLSVGDVVFSIKQVRKGESPQSMMGIIALSQDK